MDLADPAAPDARPLRLLLRRPAREHDAALDQVLDWHAIWLDVTKRRFIYVGFTAFVLLIPLAATSTSGALKRLGYARWKRLHRLAYVAPILGVIHFTWRVKKDVREPMAYAVVLGALLLVRLTTAWRLRAATALAEVKGAAQIRALSDGAATRRRRAAYRRDARGSPPAPGSAAWHCATGGHGRSC